MKYVPSRFLRSHGEPESAGGGSVEIFVGVDGVDGVDGAREAVSAGADEGVVFFPHAARESAAPHARASVAIARAAVD